MRFKHWILSLVYVLILSLSLQTTLWATSPESNVSEDQDQVVQIGNEDLFSEFDSSKIFELYNDVEILDKETLYYSIDIDNASSQLIYSTKEPEVYDIKDIIPQIKNEYSIQNNKLTYRMDMFYLVADIAIDKPKFVSAGAVTNVSGSGTKPKNYTVSLKNTISNTRSGVYSNDKEKNVTVKLKEEFVLESPISITKYWKGVTVAKANFDGSLVITAASASSDVMLLNKKGIKYPSDYKDRQSGIVMWEPPANLTANARTPGSKYRENFIEYYERNWGAPTYFKWTDVQIHHMRPVKYNGQDSVSNLIPLWKPGSSEKNGIKNHTELNNWWRNY
ncbi:hypothetical protein GCM10008014_12340 [Paenibacillus silvae]|uniref:HNH endonuclease n=1 Tax=Paenibacillus silvae TaxID=1325358 RepID=A0ABQ1Z323_9BACL|nr:hypothetical protein [Paenibacillus silvae]GGH48429.1 hypothetical protein GCM10008014_12340 [Paenibacillus silvae]